MMRRLKMLAVWAALIFGLGYMFASTRGGDEREDGLRGVRMEEVALSRLVPAVAAGDVENGTCRTVRDAPGGTSMVQMRIPAAPGEVHIATLSVDASGRVVGFTESREGPAASTSIDVSRDSASVLNITGGRALMTMWRGTADEALRSEVLGSPARRIDKILARCGRPDETN